MGHRNVYIYTVGHLFPKGRAACAKPGWICRLNSKHCRAEPCLTVEELPTAVLGGLKPWHEKEWEEKGRHKGDSFNSVKEKCSDWGYRFVHLCGKRSKRLVYIEGLFVRVGIQPSARMFVFHWAQKFEEEKPVMFRIFRTCHMPYAVMKLFFEMERHWMAVASVQGERLEYWVLCSNVFKHSL